MTQELKNALSTIAEYDGLWDVIQNVNCFKYHTSADALLPVYRKLGEEYLTHAPEQKSRVAEALAGLDYQSKLRTIESTGRLILSGEYPSACIKLAKIIKQIK